ncbi:hypothetical protein N7499_004680 [Penicillium canescens]|nr:hypothetical protein N7499_004680 [Penicillium canescens]
MLFFSLARILVKSGGSEPAWTSWDEGAKRDVDLILHKHTLTCKPTNLNRIDSSRHSTPIPYTRLQKDNTFIDDIAKILDELDEGCGGEFEDPDYEASSTTWKLQPPIIARNLRHGTIEDEVDFLDAYDSLQDVTRKTASVSSCHESLLRKPTALFGRHTTRSRQFMLTAHAATSYS